jgi:GT2 family glycosyltransferase
VAFSPEIDVIVPQYGQVGHTLRFLRSFKTHAPGTARIILVDNGTDVVELRKVLLELGELDHVLIQNTSNLGFVKAVNQGIDEVTAPFMVIQNNDTEIYAGCYQGLQGVLNSHPQGGVVGAVSSPCQSWVAIQNLMRMYPELKEIPGLMEAGHSHKAGLLREHMKGKVKYVGHMVPFFCVMFRTETVRAAGPLSEDYGIGLGDDDDYCARLRSLGYEILLDLSTYVFHNHRTTFKSLYSEEQIKTMQKENVAKFLERWRGKR